MPPLHTKMDTSISNDTNIVPVKEHPLLLCFIHIRKLSENLHKCNKMSAEDGQSPQSVSVSVSNVEHK